MSKEVLQACLDVFRENDCLETIDITGGAPEMNPNFEWFLREACQICGHVIVRCNLTILTEDHAGYDEPILWAPETDILFLSDRAGVGDGIFGYLMRPDGSDVRLFLRL